MMLRQIGFRRILPGLVAPNLEQRFFGSGQQGGVYLFDKAHQGGLFQDAAFTTPVTAVEQYVGSFLDWSGNGNHCAQTTSTARSKWSARVNRLTKTEQFSDAVWGKVNGVTVTQNAITSLGRTLDKIVPSAVLGYQVIRQIFNEGSSGDVYITSAIFKAGEYGFGTLSDNAFSRFAASFNLISGAVANQTGSVLSAWMEPLGDGVYRCYVKFTRGGNPFYPSIGVSPFAGLAAGGPSFVGDGYSGAYSSAASTIRVDAAHLPYQRVNTATDYDTAGFPHYLDFDGTDDYYASIGNIDFSGTDKMTVVAGYTKGDAGTSMQPLVEFLGYSSAGSFGLYTNPSGQLAQIQLSSFGVNLYAAGYPPGLAYVITAQTDLAAPFMQIRRDGVLAHQSSTAPTGTPYGNAALHIGRRFIGSGFLKGPVHGLIVRGAASSDAELSFAERYLANLQGRAL